MNVQTTAPQSTPPMRRAARARERADRPPALAGRRRRAAGAALPGPCGRGLLHPVGGLEGYTPAEVHAEQIRERLTRGGEPPTRGTNQLRPATHYLSVEG